VKFKHGLLGLAALMVMVLAGCNSTPNGSGNPGVGADDLLPEDTLDQTVQILESSNVLSVSSSGTASLRESGTGSDGLKIPEFRRSLAGANALLRNYDAALPSAELSQATRVDEDRVPNKLPGNLKAPSVLASLVVQPGQVQRLDSEAGKVLSSFNGLNFREQRLANNGNQFSVEPPDQGLCVGNGYILESVNTVLRLRKTDGTAVTGVIDLNTFYGYPAAIDRTKPAGQPRFGPSMSDPVCLYDVETKRWFHVILVLFTDPVTGNLTGKNNLDVAVSKTSDPTGEWVIYRIPAQNDGTDGTPNHGCSAEADEDGNPKGNGPCLADYPQLSADGEGFYITTNEFSIFGPEFKSANIWAISKHDLADAEPTVKVVNFETLTSPAGVTGYTLQGGHVDGKDFNSRFGGTQFFLSTTNVTTATDDRIAVWALTNTRSLSKRTPKLKLINTVVKVNPYGDPVPVEQKKGNFPLGECINDTTMTTPFGPGCWQFIFAQEPKHEEVLSRIAANDARMHKVAYVDGKLWGANSTFLSVGGRERAGIEYYIIRPKLTKEGLSASVYRQGYLAVLDNSIIFPEIAVNKKGHGAIGFTLVGVDHHPSAAFATISEDGTGPVQIAAAGVGPQDGFSGYKAFSAPNPPRVRWQDYGGATVDPESGNIWLAGEYIAQTCTLAEYTTAPLGSCGGTRAALGNWGTRISLIQP
jgi:hypothetical protein